MNHTTFKQINSPVIYTAIISMTALAGSILSLQWLAACPDDCIKEWLNLILPLSGILLIILEVGLIGLAFFFAWQHYKVLDHRMVIERMLFENKWKDEEQSKQKNEADKRFTYQQKRDIVNDKFRLIEIAKKQVETEQKSETDETPASKKIKRVEAKKKNNTEEIALDHLKSIFPELFENNNAIT